MGTLSRYLIGALIGIAIGRFAVAAVLEKEKGRQVVWLLPQKFLATYPLS